MSADAEARFGPSAPRVAEALEALEEAATRLYVVAEDDKDADVAVAALDALSVLSLALAGQEVRP